MVDVETISLDSFNFSRLDLIKIDVEGMELDALAGGVKSIGKNRPMLLVEMVKTDKNKLHAWLENLDYPVGPIGNEFHGHTQGRQMSPVLKFVP
jgi:hypothetical protein